MNVREIEREVMHSPRYDFLRNHKLLGHNIVLLGLGGSYAYGTNNGNSDIDIRGIAVNSPRNILTGQDFEQVVDEETDTTMYSFDKIIRLLCSCNPNTIEILGLKSDQYLIKTDIGDQLLKNKTMFLSKRAIHSFGGYANAQLRRLENKSARLVDQTRQEEYILKSIEHASVDWKNKYLPYPEDAIKIYVDKTDREGYDSEIYMDANINGYPLRDFADLWSEMNTVVKSYAKIGKRNERAIERGKLGKHMMHLVRLYFMCFDILEKKEINTYRENEHDLLMDIRNGKYLDENRQPSDEFYEMIDELEKRLEYDGNNTDLPEYVDMEQIYDFVADINKRVILY